MCPLAAIESLEISDRSRIVDEIDKEEAFVPFLKDLIIYIIFSIFRIIQR